MKISNSLSLLGAVALLCACTNDDAMVTPPAVDGNEETFEPSEVAIQLGAGNSDVAGAHQDAPSRAPILDDGSGTIKNLAVWCLAKEAMQGNVDSRNIKWFGPLAENKSCCIMNNVKSTISAHTVIWDDANAKYFYPVNMSYRYEFYANHPYTADVVYTPTSVAANYIIDGTQDLIWGRATSNETYAWSAKYFRVNNGQTSENRPSLKLEHLTTRLVFHVQPGASVEIPGAGEDELDYSVASSMTVDSLQICDAYTRLTVNIADFNSLDMNIGNRLVRTNSITDTLYLKNAAGAFVPAIRVPAKPSLKARWGESIMLFPANSYMVRLVLHDSIGRKFVSEIPLALSQNGGFERGKSYNITITVHGPTAVSLGAQLTPWENVDGPELEL